MAKHEGQQTLRTFEIWLKFSLWTFVLKRDLWRVKAWTLRTFGKRHQTAWTVTFYGEHLCKTKKLWFINDNIENKKKRKILRGSISVEHLSWKRGIWKRGVVVPAEKVQMRGSFWGKKGQTFRAAKVGLLIGWNWSLTQNFNFKLKSENKLDKGKEMRNLNIR